MKKLWLRFVKPFFAKELEYILQELADKGDITQKQKDKVWGVLQDKLNL